MTEYKMVPVEPTPEIRRAILARFTGIPAHYADAIWTAALPLPPPATSPDREEALTLAAWCRDEMQGYVNNAPERAVLGRIEALLRRIAGGA
jgi:hypothetical protein